MGDSGIPVEKLEHANTLGSTITKSDSPYMKNGFKNPTFDRPELDFTKVESSKGGISKDIVAGATAEPSSLA